MRQRQITYGIQQGIHDHVYTAIIRGNDKPLLSLAAAPEALPAPGGGDIPQTCAVV